ncbi:MAG TPA: hypothetical protein PK402_06655 [Tepidisphaeraceae bacterium]|nr:hypothetical protein [Tepidisphaeraceae bacterium]
MFLDVQVSVEPDETESAETGMAALASLFVAQEAGWQAVSMDVARRR